MAGGTTTGEVGRSQPAVFISDASHDAVIAEAIVDALEHARGLARLQPGDTTKARQTCETEQRSWQGPHCLSILHHRLEQQPAAERELAPMRAENGDRAAYQDADIHAQWGDAPTALDPLIGPLRGERRFQAILGKLSLSDMNHTP